MEMIQKLLDCLNVAVHLSEPLPIGNIVEKEIREYGTGPLYEARPEHCTEHGSIGNIQIVDDALAKIPPANSFGPLSRPCEDRRIH
jgi:hypothetical protein